jgi:hypothetical protein
MTDDVTIEVSTGCTDEPDATALGAAPVPQRILTDADADAAKATFSLSEFNLFYQFLVDTEDRFISVSKVLQHRYKERVLVAECILYTPAAYPLYDLEEDEEEEEEEDDDDDDEKQVWTPEEMRIKAKKEAEAKVKKALASINAAEKACGGLFADEFKLAREKLRACMDPLATGAAAAERIIRKIMMNCFCAKAMKALKKADRDLRDVVVLQCCSRCEDPKDRDAFVELGKQTYGGEFEDKEHRAQLLLAYDKVGRLRKWGFKSNNQKLAERVGRRPRRGFYRNQHGVAASSSSWKHGRANTGGASCAAALQEPAYVYPTNQSQSGMWGLRHILHQIDGDEAPVPAWNPWTLCGTKWEHWYDDWPPLVLPSTGVQEHPSTLHHPPTKYQQPKGNGGQPQKGKGNGGQPQKGKANGGQPQKGNGKGCKIK